MIAREDMDAAISRLRDITVSDWMADHAIDEEAAANVLTDRLMSAMNTRGLSIESMARCMADTFTLGYELGANRVPDAALPALVTKEDES